MEGARPRSPTVALLPAGLAPKDVVAGLVLSALLVPQGMAYAELAGLPPVTGLYTSILCLIGYALFGPSRVLVLGPDSSLGPMIAATILAAGARRRRPGPSRRARLDAGAHRRRRHGRGGTGALRFVADLLSKPTQIGYMNGLALTIVVGQLPKLFGFSVDADGLDRRDQRLLLRAGRRARQRHGRGIGVSPLVGILLLQRLIPKVPRCWSSSCSPAGRVNLFDLQAQGVETIGVLPQGFPPLTIPTVPWADVPPLFLGALAIAVVALADTMSTASSFAARRGERVRGNQEMIGIGAANISAGFFQGFPVSTSGSRTAVSEQAGSRSQVTGIVGAAVITVVLLFATGLMQYVPQPTLGAIVIAAALSLADVPGNPAALEPAPDGVRLSLDRRVLGVALLGVLPGILLAIPSVDPQRVPAGLVAAPRRARAGRGPRRPARHRHLPSLAAAARARRLPLRRPADLRQLADVRGHVRRWRRSNPTCGG